MRGHQALLELRRGGLRPGLVFVDLVAEHSPITADWQTWGKQAHLAVLETEPIRTLDLRCLVGLHVIASGLDAERVARLHEACKAAGAARVVSMVLRWHGDEVRTVHTRDSMAETVEA
jgi:hypothetical protein